MDEEQTEREGKGTPIKWACVFPNGMVMVFDHNEQQMPYYQGHKDEVLPKIREVYSGPIEAAVWR